MQRRLVVDYFEELAREAQASDPTELAHKIKLLHEGAVVVAQVSAEPEVAVQARIMAKALLDAS